MVKILEIINEKKKTIEGSIIGCFVQEPDLISEHALDKDMLSDDGVFYYSLLTHLYGLGYEKFDEVSIFSFIQKNDGLTTQYEERGGYRTLEELSAIVDTQNMDGYIDSFNKYALLIQLDEKGFNVSKEFDKFEKMTSSQVFDYFEYQLNSITVDVASDINFESFEITDSDIQRLIDGENVGIQYGKHSPLLNYLTLGIPRGNFTILGSYVNVGKSSMISNMFYSIARRGEKVGIIANEMAIEDYKQLLLIYVLVNDMRYFGLTRKKIKMGQFDDEDMKAIRKAQEIIREHYVDYLYFAETFDYDMTKTKRIIKRWSKLGVELIGYDTLKYNVANESSWKDLIESTRDLYQLASKEDIAIIGVMQLALHTKQRRILDLDVLANGKQSSEVASEVLLMRDILPDEWPGEKNEVKCYNYVRDANGNSTGVKEMIELNPESTYRLIFVGKTRNDQVGTAVLYRFDGYINRWVEKGRAIVSPDVY